MPRLVFTERAARDLDGILRHLMRQGAHPRIAHAFVGDLRVRCRALAALPGRLGRPRSEYRPDIRSVAHRGYVIFFRYRTGTLEVAGVMEGHRDAAALLREDDAP